ncbi:MAG TPA: hypothetical protein VHB21_03845 [Minicystis sp.]|nr:hypothetical protein [Minicystis sp.]
MATKKKTSSKGRRGAKGGARARAIEIKVDAALATAWKKVVAVLDASSREGIRAWDRKYEAVGEILAHDPPLYLAGGMATARDFFKAYLPGETPRSILRSVRVAQYASPDEEARYGTSKIDAAIDYLEATHGKAKGRIPVDFEKLRIPSGKTSLAFPSATVAAVKTAARVAARNGRNPPHTKRSPIVVALAQALPKAAKDVTIHDAGGRLTLGIPLAHVAVVLRALARAQLPVAR